MSKNILMIAYTNYSHDARVIKEAEAAVKNGFNVDYITLREGENDRNERINGVNVFRINLFKYRGKNFIIYLWSYLSFFIQCFLLVTILFIKNKYRIIHVNNMPDFLVFCAIVPKFSGAKIILDIHDPMPAIMLTKFKLKTNSLGYKLLLFEEKLSSKFADSVITVHEPIKQDILTEDGIPKEKIFVVANFADDSLFNINYNYSLKYPLKCIFHGTISERAGFRCLLEAINKIENKHHFYFKIIGEGDYSVELKRLIKELELIDLIDFENKVFSYKDLPDILNAFHLGLATYEPSPATEYMLPVKMIEYLLLGIPFITIPNKAITYYLGERDCFFYDPHDPSSLTALLNNLSNNFYLIIEKRERIIALRDNFLWINEEKKYVNHLKLLGGF